MDDVYHKPKVFVSNQHKLMFFFNGQALVFVPLSMQLSEAKSMSGTRVHEGVNWKAKAFQEFHFLQAIN